MDTKKNPLQNAFAPMDPNQIMREMYALVKSSTETTYGVLSTLQNQTEQMANMFLDSYSNLETENHRFVSDWLKTTKHHQVELQKAYSQGIDRIAEIIMPKLEWEFEFDLPAEITVAGGDPDLSKGRK
jgi:hypothetical protein